MRKKLLVLKDVTVSYDEHIILNKVCLDIEEGDWVIIKGLNGEGKTSLVKAILSLIPYTGSIRVYDEELHNSKVRFSYLPQRLDSVPDITVKDFLSLYGDQSEVSDILRRIDISHLSETLLSELSLGNLQLVLLGQAVIRDSQIIILDEPTSSLDVSNKDKFYNLVKELSLSGKTIIQISHDVSPLFVPTKVYTLSNTSSYDSPIVVKNQVKRIGGRASKINWRVLIALSALPLILSFVTPSETPIILRVVWGIVSGGVLSFTGAIFQSLFRNPLSSPYTLGLASGSSLGILSAFLLGIESLLLSTLFSFIGGLTSASLLIFLIRKLRLDRAFLLLGGLAYASFVTSISMLMQSYVDTSTAFIYMRWMLGGLDIESHLSLIIAFLSLIPVILLYTQCKKITSMSIDSDLTMVNLGNVNKIVLKALLLATVSISLVVSQTGPLAFVGLIVPNIVSRKFGVSLKQTLPVSFIIGAAFTLLSDAVTRELNVLSVPVTTGVVMSLIGSPILLYCLTAIKAKD